jgi:site-specific DNA-methyltransferase (cytosine-N4-specific)
VEVLREVRAKPLNNERLPVMIQGYFEDMNLAIRNISQYLKPRGGAALVVANAQFNGENVPTDLMLCELAERHGLSTEAVLVTRYKGNSSQQMAIYGRRPVRETILLWRKHG